MVFSILMTSILLSWFQLWPLDDVQYMSCFLLIADEYIDELKIETPTHVFVYVIIQSPAAASAF